MLTRSSVIIIVIVWLLCAIYGGIAKAYGYPYANVALIVAWVMSLLLLITIGIYIKRHKEEEKNNNKRP